MLNQQASHTDYSAYQRKFCGHHNILSPQDHHQLVTISDLKPPTGTIGQVAVMQKKPDIPFVAVAIESVRVEQRGSPLDTMDFIAFAQQKSAFFKRA